MPELWISRDKERLIGCSRPTERTGPSRLCRYISFDCECKCLVRRHKSWFKQPPTPAITIRLFVVCPAKPSLSEPRALVGACRASTPHSVDRTAPGSVLPARAPGRVVTCDDLCHNLIPLEEYQAARPSARQDPIERGVVIDGPVVGDGEVDGRAAVGIEEVRAGQQSGVEGCVPVVGHVVQREVRPG